MSHKEIALAGLWMAGGIIIAFAAWTFIAPVVQNAASAVKSVTAA